ncbi:MAG: hypothetical protein PWP08_1874, partial [Methanofollis sp.]|nr:hypothetical protein [Methanofollis sp.]
MLRRGSDEAVYVLVGSMRCRIAPEDLRILLASGRAVPVMGEGTAIVGHAAAGIGSRAVKIFTVS